MTINCIRARGASASRTLTPERSRLLDNEDRQDRSLKLGS